MFDVNNSYEMITYLPSIRPKNRWFERIFNQPLLRYLFFFLSLLREGPSNSNKVRAIQIRKSDRETNRKSEHTRIKSSYEFMCVLLVFVSVCVWFFSLARIHQHLCVRQILCEREKQMRKRAFREWFLCYIGRTIWVIAHFIRIYDTSSGT